MSTKTTNVESINQLLVPDSLSDIVVQLFTTYKSAKSGWEEEQKELRNYLFATDTSTTSNKSLPWKNSTTTPKLAQIRDNLHANYMQALFPHDDWFKWQAMDQESASREVALVVEAYVKNKVRTSGFKQEVSRVLYDYIDYGNAFGEVNFTSESTQSSDNSEIPVYVGPKLARLSPYDIVFDVTAKDFHSANKITRSIISLGSLMRVADEDPEFGWVKDGLTRVRDNRMQLSSFETSEVDKSAGYVADGFGSLSHYYGSNMVELLEFEGDLYDIQTDTLLSRHKIVVADRNTVVVSKPLESWLGTSNKEHVAWRLRPDNLMGMGPLNNLVGMQYRVDHLENLKADVFDIIAHPVIVNSGYVEPWEWGPGEQIFSDQDSRVDILAPDTTALNADFQIQNLLNLMEEMAGAPKQAMGIRTPGEKTAFEVQSLENAAGRIFQHKIQQFEEFFLEPILNQMFEAARRNLGATGEDIALVDEDFGTPEFRRVLPENIKARGKLVPIGARHFARQAQVVQNILGWANSAVYQDPGVNAHVSGLRLAELSQELLGLEKFDLVSENIRVVEAQQTQRIASAAQDQELEDQAATLANAEVPLDDA